MKRQRRPFLKQKPIFYFDENFPVSILTHVREGSRWKKKIKVLSAIDLGNKGKSDEFHFALRRSLGLRLRGITRRRCVQALWETCDCGMQPRPGVHTNVSGVGFWRQMHSAGFRAWAILGGRGRNALLRASRGNMPSLRAPNGTRTWGALFKTGEEKATKKLAL